MINDYKKKYLKYKNKYFNSKKIHGGMDPGNTQSHGYAPSPYGYAPSPCGYAPSPCGYAPSPCGYAPPPQGYAPPPQGYAPPPQGYVDQSYEYAPPQQGYVEPQQGYAPEYEEQPYIPSSVSTNGQVNILRKKLNEAMEENEYLKTHCAHIGFDSYKGYQNSPFTKNTEIPLFFKSSGPFIYNKKTKLKEDQITEFKQYEVYSNYNPTNKNIYQGDGDKDLNYKDGVKTTDSLRFILRKTFVGFLNTTGGRLFIGITDDGISVGIPNVHTRGHIDYLEQIISSEVFNNITPRPSPDNIRFIWHWVYHHANYQNTENGSHDYWILEIQISPGSIGLLYESPMDLIKDRYDKKQTIWFRQATATISVSKSMASDFITQQKLVGCRELIKPLEDESGLELCEIEEIEELEKKPEIVLKQF